MTVPPVFNVDDLTPDLIDDLREASHTYLSYAYTRAFDQLFTNPDRAILIHRFLIGDVPAELFAHRIREWLLTPWSSTRSLGNGRMEAVAKALAQVRPAIAAIPDTLHLDAANSQQLNEMAEIFETLDDCAGVGPTIASKLLAPLRPALFPIWDNPIATAYGFALSPAGYHQYLNMTRAIASKAREFWRWRSSPLERTLCSNDRLWQPPLAKVIDEWNWIRITRKTPRRIPPEPRGIRPSKQPIKEALRRLLNDIYAERVHIRKLNSGAAVHVNYIADNGWKLQVFNDAGDWDYLESAEDPNGNTLDYEDINSEERIDEPLNSKHWGLSNYSDPDPEFPDDPDVPC